MVLLMPPGQSFSSNALFQRKQQLRQQRCWTTCSFVSLRQPDHDDEIGTADDTPFVACRRAVLSQFVVSSIGSVTAAATLFPIPTWANEELSSRGSADNNDNMYSHKFVQQYEDFTETKEGWSYRDVTPGKAGTTSAAKGDRVVFDWSGYTIGYFGRPFQAKGGPQGGAFDKDIDYARTVLGSHSIVRGLEQALEGMQPGQVRQVVIPYGPLSYPGDDATHDRVGPKPITFSGQRALNFVLDNPRIDRTLLFNVKVIRVDKPNGKGGFVRGET